MKRYIVLGVNENPKYLYYLPLVVWAWNRLGWNTICFYNGDVWLKTWDLAARFSVPYLKFEVVNDVEGYKSETIAQFSRFYACCVANGFMMTSDIDMIPLSDYWKCGCERFDIDYPIHCYGRNLSNEHQPVCYVGASAYHWSGFMDAHDGDYQYFIERDLKAMNGDKRVWTWDQTLLTRNLYKYQHEKRFIDREINPVTHYPIGRVDRSAWTLNHKTLIDCHAPHDILTNDESFRKVMQLLHHVWPSTDFKWLLEYTKEFKKLL